MKRKKNSMVDAIRWAFHCAIMSGLSLFVGVGVSSQEPPLISDIDFGASGTDSARLIVRYSDPATDVDIAATAKKITVRFKRINLPQKLDRRLDVSDFSTPIAYIDSKQSNADVILTVGTKGPFSYKSIDNPGELLLEVFGKINTQPQFEEERKKEPYTGDLMDLKFQNIKVRDVLELIADFKSLNLVASDSVQGDITLNLDNVPSDQALDIIMQSKGLGMRQTGNILLVAPIEEIAEREQKEVDSRKKLLSLSPLVTHVARIKYAKAQEVFKLLSGGSVGSGGGSEKRSQSSLFSERGSAAMDDRTNTIIITDIQQKIDAFKILLATIDIPVKQVLIEARIVKATSDFRKELGASWGLAGAQGVNLITDLVADPSKQLSGRLASDLGLASPTSAFSLGYLSDNFLIDLELNALQASGFGEIVSRPKVLTADKEKASIKSGVEIPYQAVTQAEGTNGGVVETQFKEAVLLLEVTPQITPDNRVIMDLLIKQDSVGSLSVNGEPAIDITEISTQALVGDGQTLVLGGIFQSEEISSVDKVPFLGDLPGVGGLFRKELRVTDKREILIFITPKVIDDSFVDK